MYNAGTKHSKLFTSCSLFLFDLNMTASMLTYFGYNRVFRVKKSCIFFLLTLIERFEFIRKCYNVTFTNACIRYAFLFVYFYDKNLSLKINERTCMIDPSFFYYFSFSKNRKQKVKS